MEQPLKQPCYFDVRIWWKKKNTRCVKSLKTKTYQLIVIYHRHHIYIKLKLFSFDTTQHGCYSELLKNKEEANGPHRSPEKPDTFAQSYDHITSYHTFLISEWSLFVKPWVSFTKGCFVTSLVEIGPVILEKKIFCFVNVFSLFHNNFPLEKGGALHLNKL